jgi:hypothetical protein
VRPSGAVTFENSGVPVAGCSAVRAQPLPTTQPISQAVCQTSFSASSSSEQLTAAFVSSTSTIANSSAALAVSVARSGTTTSLDVSNPSNNLASTATYTATVTPAVPGAIVPSGTVEFSDNGKPIAACASALTGQGSSAIATCSSTYTLAGSHRITAAYGGDVNFGGSATATAQLVVVEAPPPRVLGTVSAFMRWTFYFTPSYTEIRTLAVTRAPVGAAIIVACRGRGCPFARRVNSIKRGPRCPAGRCSSTVLNLLAAFRHRRLRPRTRITVEITRSRWIGKYYEFTMRSAHPPVIRIDCLAPGKIRPGVGC